MCIWMLSNADIHVHRNANAHQSKHMLKLRFGDASTCFPSLLYRFLNTDRYKQRQRELVLSKQIASKAAVCVVGSRAMIHDLLTMRHGIGADIICARFNYSLAYLLKRLFIPLDLVLCAPYAYFISTYIYRSVACDTTEESVCVFVHTNVECGCVLVGLVVHTQDTSMEFQTPIERTNEQRQQQHKSIHHARSSQICFG